VAEAFKIGGRIIYVGAGTSGRLGVLDASECPPTFGSDPEMVQGIVAGGFEALVRAQEGSEDKKEQGISDLLEKRISSKDVVCGIAASQRTPYVIGALEEAKKLGAKTIFVICNPREVMQMDVDVAICPVSGPEVIMGSTRMKAGSAQKMVLNILTTTAMIKQGKIYENMMIDLQQNSQKLIERSKKIIMLATDKNYEEASHFLAESNGLSPDWIWRRPGHFWTVMMVLSRRRSSNGVMNKNKNYTRKTKIKNYFSLAILSFFIYCLLLSDFEYDINLQRCS
jgi:N-acetylmuramic acid 6-phosphate etherase